jgi:FkbM family methyltransferase
MSVEILPLNPPHGVAVISGDQYVTKWVRENGRLEHEPWLSEQFTKYVRPGDVCVDAGCNIGQSSLPMLRAGGIVHAFDINPDCILATAHNCEQYKDRLFLYGDAALGDSVTEKVSFNHDESNAGASYVSEGGGLPVRTLDSYGLENLRFIKIDVEGFEPRVLRGAKETIARCQPIMFVEMNGPALERQGSSQEEVWRLLESAGYIVQVAQDNCGRGDVMYDVWAFPAGLKDG